MQRLDGQIHPGDLVLIQFAHNDASDKPERHAEPWTAYSENLKVFVDFARQRQAVPVLLTPICMRIWENGVLQPTHDEYRKALRTIAQKLDVPLIDLYGESFRMVSEAGEEGSKAFFLHIPPNQDPLYPDGVSDNAHTRRAGAERFAAHAAKRLTEMGLIQ